MRASGIPSRPELTGPFAFVAYRSGYVFAVITGAAGISGLMGELPGLGRLGQPLIGWPRIPFLASVALVALGFALWQFLQLRYRSAFLSAGIAAASALLSLAAQLTSLPISRDVMSLASAVLILTASSPLMIVSARRRLLPEDASVGVAGFILLALAATLLIARATGLTKSTLDMLGAGPSPQMLVSCFLIGICYVALVWTRGLLSGDSAAWLPAALGIAGVVTVLMLWRGLAARENDQIVALTRQAGDERRRVLVHEAVATARSLHRASEWRASGATLAEQRRDVSALQRDMPGLEGAGWISALGVIDTAASSSLSGVGADSVTIAYVNANHRLPDSMAYLPLDSATKRFVILAPACTQSICKGTMIGVMRTSRLFRDLIPDTSRGFRYAIVGRAGRLAGPSPDSDRTRAWLQWLDLQLGDVHLTLSAWPTRNTIEGVRSSLPLLVLLMGLAVSGLVPVSVILAQQALRGARESERARITEALERTTDGVWEWDVLTGASAHSPGIWRYLGYDPASVPPIRDAWLALVHPDDQARLAQEIADCLSGARPSFDAEYRVLARDGKWHAIVDRGRVVDRTASGHPSRMLGIKADVTVARSAAHAREAAEQRFREIFDSGFQFQLLLDRAGAVVEVNHHALQEFGVVDADVRGRLVWNTLWWNGNAPAQERLRVAVSAAARGLTRRFEEEFALANRAEVSLEIAVKPLTGESEEDTQLLLEARDLSARRRAEATLREVETLTTMGRVAAQVAHEINNPLAGIQNSFLLIKGAIPTTHPHYKYVGAIEREVARIAAVTRQLYETYRPEQDGHAGASPATVIGDAVAFLEQVNRATSVKVQVVLGPGPTVLPIPAALLRQIVYNLVQNAIEASPAGGLVVVQTLLHDGQFELLVRDHGAGIPPDSRERIFEPFYSTKSGRLRTGGMGLGLALVRRTVTASGGTIRVHDVNGEGCEFVVTLPLHPVREESL
jgi:PAS domain S-box-containing protein